MKSRVVMLTLIALAVLLLVGDALLIPSHVRAVDARVIDLAGRGTPTSVDAGLKFLSLEKTGPAELCLALARRQSVPGYERLEEALQGGGRDRLNGVQWGGVDAVLSHILGNKGDLDNPPQTVVELLVNPVRRETLLDALRRSRRPAVQGILEILTVTNLTLLPPASVPGGQATELVVGVLGLLYQGDYLTGQVRDALAAMVDQSINSGAVRPLEEVLLDTLALVARFDWVQLTSLLSEVTDLATLHELASLCQNAPGQTPTLFVGVVMSGQPAKVVRYVRRWGPPGFVDLEYALGRGKGGVEELLWREQRIHYPRMRSWFESLSPLAQIAPTLTRWAHDWPTVSLGSKYLLLLLAGWLLAWGYRHSSGTYEVPPVPALASLAAGRLWLFALTFVLAMIVLSEPFLARNIQGAEYPLRVQIPVFRSAALAAMVTPIKPYMDQISLVALVSFFVLQLIMYVLNLIKLAEIRRQPITAALKLKYLENEDMMFDAGLYIGLAGSVLSLGCLALGIIKPSLAAAYSSTLFGIIFVAILKICHVRPVRRRLLLEREQEMV